MRTEHVMRTAVKSMRRKALFGRGRLFGGACLWLGMMGVALAAPESGEELEPGQMASETALATPASSETQTGMDIAVQAAELEAEAPKDAVVDNENNDEDTNNDEDNAAVLLIPAPRQGYFLSLSLGGVGVASRDEQGWDPGLAGFGMAIRMGQGITPWMSLGIGFHFDSAQKTAVRRTIGAGLSLEAQFHPLFAQRYMKDLSILVGVGFGVLSSTDLGAPEELQGASAQGGVGANLSLAVAYDFFVVKAPGRRGSGGLGISPYVAFRALPGPDAQLDGYFVGAGVSLAWWFGLPANQLELPLDAAFEG